VAPSERLVARGASIPRVPVPERDAFRVAARARSAPKIFTSVRAAAAAASTTPPKLALVVRTDLAMGRGKLCAQAAHGAVLAAAAAPPALLAAWVRGGQPKVVLRAASEAALRALLAAAGAAGVRAALVTDAGRTQVPAGTPTVVAVGPAAAAEVDALCGAMKLL
jgi:PTH2 family peptidyl-tRNA hydrolase